MTWKNINNAGATMRSALRALAIACPALLMACNSDPDPTRVDEANGEIDGLKGDWADATPLFEKAYDAHPDAVGAFNLASSYQNTGQNDKAIALYEVVLIDGYYTDTHLNTPNGAAPESNPGIFLSEEATNRLAVMASRKALADSTAVLVKAKAVPLEKLLVCDFPAANGRGTGHHGRIFVFVDDNRRTASTLGFFATAPDQQEIDQFGSAEILWTQRYRIVGHVNVYRYKLNRVTGTLDVSRPALDNSVQFKVTASCHAAAGA